MNVGIIGGGITGLTLGYELAKKGINVTIFEKDARLGGLAGCFQTCETKVEKYYHHFFKTDSDIINIIEELDLSHKLVFKKSQMGFYKDGSIYSFGSPKDLLKFSPLSPVSRIKFGLQVLKMKGKKHWEDLENITIEEWHKKRKDTDIFDAIWKPLLISKFGDDYKNISASWLWGRIHPRAQSRKNGGEHLGYLLGGMELLFDSMRKSIEEHNCTIKTTANVTKILENSNSLTLYDSKDNRYELDRIFFTGSTHELHSIVSGFPKEYTSLLDSIKYKGVICAVLILKKSLSNIYWMNIIDSQSKFGLLVEHTNFIPKKHYKHNHIVYLPCYVDHQDNLFALSEDEIIDNYLESLISIFPEFNKDWIREISLFKDLYATPVYSLNYSKNKPSFKTPISHLYLVNTSQVYPEDRNMNNCIKNARQVLKELEMT